MKTLIHIAIVGIITVSAFTFHEEMNAQEISAAKKSEYYKQHFTEQYSKNVKKNFRNKKTIRKTKLVSATPKIDSIFGRSKMQPIAAELQQISTVDNASTTRSLIVLLAAIVLALSTTGGIFFYYFKSSIQQSQKRIKPNIVEQDIKPQPIIAVTPKQMVVESSAFPFEFYDERIDESELLIEKFQKSQEELELETTLCSSPTIELFKKLSPNKIGKSMKRKITSAKKIGVGVGEVLLYQRLRSLEKETIQEMVQ